MKRNPVRLNTPTILKKYTRVTLASAALPLCTDDCVTVAPTVEFGSRLASAATSALAEVALILARVGGSGLEEVADWGLAVAFAKCGNVASTRGPSLNASVSAGRLMPQLVGLASGH